MQKVRGVSHESGCQIYKMLTRNLLKYGPCTCNDEMVKLKASWSLDSLIAILGKAWPGRSFSTTRIPWAYLLTLHATLLVIFFGSSSRGGLDSVLKSHSRSAIGHVSVSGRHISRLLIGCTGLSVKYFPSLNGPCVGCHSKTQPRQGWEGHMTSIAMNSCI